MDAFSSFGSTGYMFYRDFLKAKMKRIYCVLKIIIGNDILIYIPINVEEKSINKITLNV